MDAETYLQWAMEEEGTYRVFPLAWTLKKYDSGSVALVLQLGISQRWHGKEQGWSEPFAPGFFTTHKSWIITIPKDPKTKQPIPGQKPVLNEKAIKRLSEVGLWQGFDAIEGPPPQIFLLTNVVREVNDGNVYYSADWLNANADEPKARGAFAPVDKGLLSELQALHGAKARAMTAGAAGTQTAAPAPPSPPGAAAPAPAAPQTAAPAAPAPPAAGTPQPPTWGGSVPGAAPTQPDPLAHPPAAPAAPAPPAAPSPPAPQSAAHDPADPFDPGDTPF